MKLGPIIDRISAGALGFKTVDGIETVADLETTPVPLPAAFVVPAADDFLPEQEGAGLIVLENRANFDVVIMIAAAAQRGRVRDELSGFADAVIEQLLGWSPDASVYRPIIPVSGRLLGLGGGRVSWTIRFRTAYRLRKQG